MIAVVIVGINQWEEYTSLLIDSIKTIEPDVKIYCVDAGSKEPYPQVDGVTMFHEKTKSYAQAINIAAFQAIADGADWILSMNNDVSCLGKFSHLIDCLKPDAIYARQIIEERDLVWFGNWIVLIPAELYALLDGFDEDYLICGFEDADISARAKQIGYMTKPIDLPFFHHWGKTRWGIPEYPQVRLDNIARFTAKFGWTPGSNMRVTHD